MENPSRAQMISKSNSCRVMGRQDSNRWVEAAHHATPLLMYPAALQFLNLLRVFKQPVAAGHRLGSCCPSPLQRCWSGNKKYVARNNGLHSTSSLCVASSSMTTPKNMKQARKIKLCITERMAALYRHFQFLLLGSGH